MNSLPHSFDFSAQEIELFTKTRLPKEVSPLPASAEEVFIKNEIALNDWQEATSHCPRRRICKEIPGRVFEKLDATLGAQHQEMCAISEKYPQDWKRLYIQKRYGALFDTILHATGWNKKSEAQGFVTDPCEIDHIVGYLRGFSSRIISIIDLGEGARIILPLESYAQVNREDVSVANPLPQNLRPETWLHNLSHQNKKEQAA